MLSIRYQATSQAYSTYFLLWPHHEFATSETTTCSHEYAAQVAVKHADLIAQWIIIIFE